MKDELTHKLELFFSSFPVRTYDKGQILLFAGDSPQHIYYLTRGRVNQYDISARGEEVVVNEFKPGAFFPLAYALNQTPNKYFFGAATESELRIAPPNKVVAFLKSNPDVLFDLMARVYRGTEGMLEKMVRLMSDTARNRLLFELYVECTRFGSKQPDGSCQLDIQETHLAARTGLARETISREIHKMKEEGLIAIRQHHIVVSDFNRLKDSLQ